MKTKVATILALSLLIEISCTGNLDEQRYKNNLSDPLDQGTLDMPATSLDSSPDSSTTPDEGMSDMSDMPSSEDASVDMPSIDMADMTTPSDMTDMSDMVDMADMAAPLASPGCAQPAGLTEGEQTFMSDELSRRYILRLPENYDPQRPWPVVFALHGNGGNPSYWDTTGSGDRDIRSVLKDQAILVVASAIDNQWRDYNMARETWPARVEMELRYFDRIVTDLKDNLCVDSERMFSMGFSGGGSFSGVLGCRRDDIRAIAVGGSVIYFDQADCINTPAAWISIGAMEQEQGRTNYLNFFRERAGCSDTSMVTTPDICVAYDDCDSGTPVHYCEHPDGHIWPAEGTQAFWEFFKQF